MHALAEETRAAFEHTVAAKLRQFWPDECRGLSDDALNARIRRGIDRALSYGIRSKPDVQRYLNLVFLLGDDFDADYPWAAAFLQEPGAPAVRIARLCEYAIRQLRGSQA